MLHQRFSLEQKKILTCPLDASFIPAPQWQIFPDWDCSIWLNGFVHAAWPCINGFVTNTVRTIAAPYLKQYRPSFLTQMDFEKLDLGNTAPVFEGVKVYPRKGRELIMDIKFRFIGHPEIVVFVVGPRWPRTEVSVENVELIGTARIKLSLIAAIPLMETIAFQFVSTPSLQFSLRMGRVSGGSAASIDVTALPAIEIAIKLVMDLVFSTFVFPKFLEFPLILADRVKPVWRTIYSEEICGVAAVYLIEAKNLKNTDLVGTSDPFAVVTLEGNPPKKTEIIDNNLNPKWHEAWYFMISDLQSQPLRVELFDHDQFDKNDELGSVVIDLPTLKERKVNDLWLKLDNGQGSVHVKIVFYEIPHECGKQQVHLITEHAMELLKVDKNFVGNGDNSIAAGLLSGSPFMRSTEGLVQKGEIEDVRWQGVVKKKKKNPLSLSHTWNKRYVVIGTTAGTVCLFLFDKDSAKANPKRSVTFAPEKSTVKVTNCPKGSPVGVIEFVGQLLENGSCYSAKLGPANLDDFQGLKDALIHAGCQAE